MVVLAVLGIDFDYKFEINDIYKIHKIIIFISIVAAIYAMIVQKQYIANLFSTERGMLEQWLYRSFFITRNNYACMCLLGGMSSMLMWSSTQKGIYLFWQLLFLFQILCTNSRNAIVALLIFYAVIIWNKASKKGIVITLLFISLPIVVFNWKEIFEYVSTHFYHYDIVRSADSSQIRIIMWKDILKNIFLEGTFIFGYGSEYSSQYLLEQYGLESAHNVFFEILFSGGICKLGIYLFLLLRIRKKFWT